MTRAQLEHRDKWLWAHDPAWCVGRPCNLHNRSEHHMRAWPQLWREDRQLMERICPHGVGHPDPDNLGNDTVHGCDGCCKVPA